MRKIPFISGSILAIIVFVLILSFQSAQAVVKDWQPVSEVATSTNEGLIKSYKNYIKVPSQNIVVPTVLEIPIDTNQIYSDYFGVYNETQKKFIPQLLLNNSQIDSNSVKAIDSNTNEDLAGLFDGACNTMKDFYLNKGEDKSSAKISIYYSKQIKSDSLNLAFDSYVSMPTTVTLKAYVDGTEVVVLNRVKPNSSRINFPITTSDKWILELEYSQPLRISEIHLNDSLNSYTKKYVRFLALPQNSYRVYANPEVVNSSYANYEEAPNLASSIGIKKALNYSIVNNPAFVQSDTDGDGIVNILDNCINTANADQADVDENGRGDVCDDFDRDGIINLDDNCAETPNYDQRDTDGDKIGDVCDTDESRFTERYPWIVWAGIGFAALVFLSLLFVTGNKIRKEKAMME
jgi:hypothetical protein